MNQRYEEDEKEERITRREYQQKRNKDTNEFIKVIAMVAFIGILLSVFMDIVLSNGWYTLIFLLICVIIRFKLK